MINLTTSLKAVPMIRYSHARCQQKKYLQLLNIIDEFSFRHRLRQFKSVTLNRARCGESVVVSPRVVVGMNIRVLFRLL